MLWGSMLAITATGESKLFSVPILENSSEEGPLTKKVGPPTKQRVQGVWALVRLESRLKFEFLDFSFLSIF
jgi:hypothetical protein